MIESRDHIDDYVDKAMDSGAEVEELICGAIDSMIRGSYWEAMVNMGHGAPVDPAECSVYGQRLLKRCVKELKKRTT